MSLLSEWLCAAAFASLRRFNENVATRYSCFDAGYLRVASIKVGPTQGTKAGNHWRQTGPSRCRESRVCSSTVAVSRILNEIGNGSLTAPYREHLSIAAAGR